MPRPTALRHAYAVCAGLAALGPLATAKAQDGAWQTGTDNAGRATAYVCSPDDGPGGGPYCFRLDCSGGAPLHFALEVPPGRSAGILPVTVRVDGNLAGTLEFSAAETSGGFSAPFDPRLDAELVRRLELGTSVVLSLGWDTGEAELAFALAGSSAALGAVMSTCPVPAPPVGDPASDVLAEVIAACSAIGGTVAMEPGFERREDLDGDGRGDLVVDYAAAVCSARPSLHCSTGGCTVGVYLARGDGYVPVFTGAIRGYDVLPGARLALDLDGAACGIYAFEACWRLYDIAGDAPVLIETVAGVAAEAAMEAAQLEIAGVAPDAVADAEVAQVTAVAPAPPLPLAEGAEALFGLAAIPMDATVVLERQAASLPAVAVALSHPDQPETPIAVEPVIVQAVAPGMPSRHDPGDPEGRAAAAVQLAKALDGTRPAALVAGLGGAQAPSTTAAQRRTSPVPTAPTSGGAEEKPAEGPAVAAATVPAASLPATAPRGAPEILALASMRHVSAQR